MRLVLLHLHPRVHEQQDEDQRQESRDGDRRALLDPHVPARGEKSRRKRLETLSKVGIYRELSLHLDTWLSPPSRSDARLPQRG